MPQPPHSCCLTCSFDTWLPTFSLCTDTHGCWRWGTPIRCCKGEGGAPTDKGNSGQALQTVALACSPSARVVRFPPCSVQALLISPLLARTHAGTASVSVSFAPVCLAIHLLTSEPQITLLQDNFWGISKYASNSAARGAAGETAWPVCRLVDAGMFGLRQCTGMSMLM